MTDARETEMLEDAAGLLTGAPWYWAVTVEYPGYLCVSFDAGEDTARAYAAGFANPTLTVDRQTSDGVSVASVDTRIECRTLDGYRLAVHTAAAIDRMEHE
jgi:hypothetical protein